ncbi:leucine-rich repeat-containing protein 15-like [Odontomachus brunneus]|uniref:leucine-rich repeat-containing protein 15-like n=1 Tax=Odontomachus brunneus TaxID=486640 RepID=UPI0013F29B84|nr:leucine-rich repeat-containing protein 15-like [Odontomachus brunneus]XP_032669566.1 leucine-rich repeat-containing protein 15-like [Odontomachus brunneus]
MKVAFAIVILACWSKLSIASDDYESNPRCNDNILSVNFSNAVITHVGRDFISSHLITCLDLSNNQIETIADGAFRKLPRLFNLYLSNNKFVDVRDLFTFGGHERLVTLILNNAVKSSTMYNVMIPGSYPNLEILSARKNSIADLTASTETPFPKLKILDLSGNNMAGINFVKLLPASLEYLILQDNSINSLSSFGKGHNVTTLLLDNNKFTNLIRYSNNPTTKGLWLSGMNNLRYFSIVGNDIRTVDSEAFTSSSNLVYLNLSKNAISSLYPGTFAKLESLRMLDLSGNQFQNIINISAVSNITTLSLSCNSIQSVPENVFKQMPKLVELLLNGNQIKEVDVNGFAYLDRLERLDLSNNKLSSLPEGWTSAFESLRHLDLSENQFTSLESLSLSNTLPLVEVYLVSNPLEYLAAGSFNNLPKNVTVNLAHKLHESVTKC